MAESQDTYVGSVVEDHNENSLSLVAKKIGTISLQSAPRRLWSKQLQSVLISLLFSRKRIQLDGQAGGGRLALHTITLEKRTEK